MLKLVSFMKFLIEALISLVMPVFSFKEPSGPYKVGTVTYDWIDTCRSEEAAKNHDDKRELMVQVWYPAEATDSMVRAPYIKDVWEIVKGLEKYFLIKPYLLRHLKDVKSNSYVKAKIKNDQRKYPVLIFSHGMTGFRNQNTFQVEELASHGYVVAAIDHSYYAAATVFSDGRIVESRLSTDPSSSDYSLEFGDKHMDTWVGDVQFVLGKLKEIDKKDPENIFTDRLDLDKIGMLGHSYGGATAAQLLIKDSRVKAGINMDGAFFGTAIPDTGLRKPFMMMVSQQAMMACDLNKLEKGLRMYGIKGDRLKEYIEFYAETDRRRKKALSGGGYSLIVKKTTHLSYSDFCLYTLLLSISQKPHSLHKIINDFTLTFFDKYIKGDKSASLENTAGKYKNVKLAQTKSK
ncbi:MAG TPA: alpha/beta fold hydrolase [Ruminiclostridium sp.]|nr:alpha/beta fold hydrolase [Ruminiclostridium sp.]